MVLKQVLKEENICVREYILYQKRKKMQSRKF